jgi:hypothetical protein
MKTKSHRCTINIGNQVFILCLINLDKENKIKPCNCCPLMTKSKRIYNQAIDKAFGTCFEALDEL